MRSVFDIRIQYIPFSLQERELQSPGGSLCSPISKFAHLNSTSSLNNVGNLLRVNRVVGLLG